MCIYLTKLQFSNGYNRLQANLDFKLAYSRAGISLNSLDHVFQMIKAGESKQNVFG